MVGVCWCMIELRPQCCSDWIRKQLLEYFNSSYFLYSPLWVTLNADFSLLTWMYGFIPSASLKKSHSTRSSQNTVCPQAENHLFGGLLPGNPLAHRDKLPHSKTPAYLLFNMIFWTPCVMCGFFGWVTSTKESLKESLFLKNYCYTGRHSSELM